MKRNTLLGVVSIVLGIASAVVGYLQTIAECDDMKNEVRADIINELVEAGLLEGK